MIQILQRDLLSTSSEKMAETCGNKIVIIEGTEEWDQNL
jgi:hypothetical protein